MAKRILCTAGGVHAHRGREIEVMCSRNVGHSGKHWSRNAWTGGGQLQWSDGVTLVCRYRIDCTGDAVTMRWEGTYVPGDGLHGVAIPLCARHEWAVRSPLRLIEGGA